MNKTKLNELKELDKLQKRIAKKKQRLEEQMKADQETAKWYDQVLKESGFKRPKDFVKALMEHFGMRTVTLTKGKRGPGRPPKSAKAGTKKKAKASGKRKRTTITAEIRDQVKEALAGGLSKNAASKQFGISYIVIKKIEDGAYNKL
jgi:malate synthase